MHNIILLAQIVGKLLLSKKLLGIYLARPPRFHGNKDNGRQMIEFIALLEKNKTLEVKWTWPCGLDYCVLDILYNLNKNI